MATIESTPETGSSGSTRYTKVAIWLHWMIGLAVISNIGLAILTEDMARETHRAAMSIHKALGITVLALTIVRILWRIRHKAPAPLSTTAVWEQRLSQASHFLFYVLLFVLPLSGWIWMSAAGRPIDFFGLFTVPAIAAPDKALADVTHESHEVLGISMLVLVTIHIVAALKHQFIDRDSLVARMNPF